MKPGAGMSPQKAKPSRPARPGASGFPVTEGGADTGAPAEAAADSCTNVPITPEGAHAASAFHAHTVTGIDFKSGAEVAPSQPESDHSPLSGSIRSWPNTAAVSPPPAPSPPRTENNGTGLQVPSQGDVAAAAFTGARNLSEAPSNLKRGRHTKQARQSLIIGTLNEKVELSVAFQDLSRDEFIIHAPRMQIEGKAVPTLGGIPLLHKLGQGGMGAVYYGIHPGFKQEVAIKVLPFHLAQKNPDLINRFFREARIAANVHSQHLVRVTDVAQEAGISYLVMEYVTGKTAAHELKLHKVCGAIGLPERTALDICIASCQGLADAHRANIVHRDVKPDNILVPKIKRSEERRVGKE